MRKHFYAFGSVCRGETDHASDIDLLACICIPDPNIDSKKFSIYSYERLSQLWLEGNPFAWHLHFESRLLYSLDGTDFLMELGKPEKYKRGVEDCLKFKNLFIESFNSLMKSSNSRVFHLSCMFLAMRNFATCYSFNGDKPNFSRSSPLLINDKLLISEEAFDIYARARILSTRGYGNLISDAECDLAKSCGPTIINWMKKLSNIESKHYE